MVGVDITVPLPSSSWVPSTNAWYSSGSLYHCLVTKVSNTEAWYDNDIENSTHASRKAGTQ